MCASAAYLLATITLLLRLLQLTALRRITTSAEYKTLSLAQIACYLQLGIGQQLFTSTSFIDSTNKIGY